MTPEEERGRARRSHLRKLRFRGRVVGLALSGIVAGAAGLFLVTGLANSPWLFLLYPVLIGLTLFSILVLALQLLHRL